MIQRSKFTVLSSRPTCVQLGGRSRGSSHRWRACEVRSAAAAPLTTWEEKHYFDNKWWATTGQDKYHCELIESITILWSFYEPWYWIWIFTLPWGLFSSFMDRLENTLYTGTHLTTFTQKIMNIFFQFFTPLSGKMIKSLFCIKVLGGCLKYYYRSCCSINLFCCLSLIHSFQEKF